MTSKVGRFDGDMIFRAVCKDFSKGLNQKPVNKSTNMYTVFYRDYNRDIPHELQQILVGM